MRQSSQYKRHDLFLGGNYAGPILITLPAFKLVFRILYCFLHIIKLLQRVERYVEHKRTRGH